MKKAWEYKTEKNGDDMELKDLKNYGVPRSKVNEIIPNEAMKELSKDIFKIMEKHLSSSDLERFQSIKAEELKQMSKQDLSTIRAKGLSENKYIQIRVEQTASFSAMSKILGMEKAIEVQYEMVEAANLKVLPSTLPSVEDFKEFEDPFTAFKEYILAQYESDKKVGGLNFNLADNTDDTLQINVTYCTWYEIPKKLGTQEICLSCCYNDDICLTNLCGPLGIKYKLANTIARGGDYCDFRFERTKN